MSSSNHQTLLDELNLPSSSVNNSRSIVLQVIQDFERCPCERHQLICENYGLTIDYSGKDHGNEIDAQEIE